MNVLFITHKYPPSIGGMEKQSYELIHRYKSIGKTHVIAYEGKEHISLFFLKLPSRIRSILNIHPDIDIIHLNDGLMAAAYTLLRIRNDKKVVVTFHGLDVVFPLGIYQNFILPKMHKYDAFICVSHATRVECIKRGFDKEKTHVVNNGVDIAVNNENHNQEKLSTYLKDVLGIDLDSDKIILSIGRPVKRKGFSWFANNVLPLLPPSYKYVHIGHIHTNKTFFDLLPSPIKKMFQLFLGSSSDEKELFRLSQLPENKNKLILAGRISDEIKNHLISTSALMIMPNIKDPGDMEGFGLVALEASILGKRVLASSIEGITDAIHDGKNGYLAISSSSVDWYEKVMSLTSPVVMYDQDVRDYTITHFDWQNMINGYETVFRSLLPK